MSDIKRACQFLPFDGLSGYGTLLAERGREREEKRQVSEDRAAVLDQMTGLLKKKTDWKWCFTTGIATAG